MYQTDMSKFEDSKKNYSFILQKTENYGQTVFL